MSKNNKKGFTLVEIIITLAIVITITTVAIGSYIGISKNKKEEEWSLVKNQIETAAEQYFTSNKYMYEDFTEGNDITGTITVKTLVGSDYLNKIVDPRTNKEVNPCSRVNVKINNGKYEASFAESTENTCSDSVSKIEFKEKDSTSGDITYHKDTYPFETVSETTNWYNSSLLGEDKDLITCIKPKQKDITKVQIDGQDITNTTRDMGYCLKVKNSTNKDIAFKLINSRGKRYQVIKKVKVDTTRPNGIINVNSASSGYNSNIVNAIVRAKDSYSGISDIIIKSADGNERGTLTDDTGEYQKKLEKYSIKIADDLDGNTYTMNSVITDEAGNEREISSSPYSVYLLCSETSYSYEDILWDDNCSNVCGGGTETGSRYIYYDDKYVGEFCSEEYYGPTSRTCGGKELVGISYGKYNSCTLTCSKKDKKKKKTKSCYMTRNVYYEYESTLDESSCSTETKVESKKKSKNCGTGKVTNDPDPKQPTTKAKSNICADISFTIPKWQGTKSFTVSASSKSKITKISSVFYEKKPGDVYTKNHEKSDKTKIAQCNPPEFKCKSGYTYLSVCATNNCGRKVCYYQQAGSTKKVRHYDNEKRK